MTKACIAFVYNLYMTNVKIIYMIKVCVALNKNDLLQGGIFFQDKTMRGVKQNLINIKYIFTWWHFVFDKFVSLSRCYNLVDNNKDEDATDTSWLVLVVGYQEQPALKRKWRTVSTPITKETQWPVNANPPLSRSSCVVFFDIILRELFFSME